MQTLAQPPRKLALSRIATFQPTKMLRHARVATSTGRTAAFDIAATFGAQGLSGTTTLYYV
jgi:hypothetical protein